VRSEHPNILRHGHLYITKAEDAGDFKTPTMTIEFTKSTFDFNALVDHLRTVTEPRPPRAQRRLVEGEREEPEKARFRAIFGSPMAAEKPATLPGVGIVRIKFPTEREPGIIVYHANEALGLVTPRGKNQTHDSIIVETAHSLAEPLLRYLLSKRFVQA
jgi:hypothetical protein